MPVSTKHENTKRHEMKKTAQENPTCINSKREEGKMRERCNLKKW